MSSITSSYKDVPRRQYIASDAFDINIFQYSTYLDPTLTTRGRLVVHPSATAVACAAGHILRENGKKLHGATHPDLVDPNSGLAYTYLVGVYDVVSGISGFINPNASFFAVLNSDKSYQDDIGAYQVDASMSNTNVPGNDYQNTGNQILGSPVNTAGTISTRGFVNSSEMHASVLVHTPGYLVTGPSNLIVNPGTGAEITYGAGTILANSNISSYANINASNGTITGSNIIALSNLTVNTGNVTVTTGNLTLTAGRLILNANCTGGFAAMTGGSNEGIYKKLQVSTTACTSNSQVFLTYSGLNNPGILSSENILNGSFRIVSTNSNDAGTVRWLVVN